MLKQHPISFLLLVIAMVIHADPGYSKPKRGVKSSQQQVETGIVFDNAKIQHELGFAYNYNMPETMSESDGTYEGVVDGKRSKYMLYENGKALGPAHTQHGDIRNIGEGRFSHWQGQFKFSASDNTDPTSNGRQYSVRKLNK